MPNIVEGEPGIFPDPVARVLRGIVNVFRRRDRSRPADDPPADADDPPADADDPPAEDTAR
jgi:hypothetical protein